MSPLYGRIGRTTPLRVSVPAGPSHLDLDGNTGGLASAPADPALDVVGDLDVRAKITTEWRLEEGVTPAPLWLPGMRITADRLNDTSMRVIEQGIDQTATTSITLVSTNLAIPGAAGAVHYYEALLSYSATSGADLRWAWSVPGSGAARRSPLHRLLQGARPARAEHR